MIEVGRLYAVMRHQILWLWIIVWHAWSSDGLGFFEALGDGQVQFQKLGQQVLFGGEAVGGEDDGVQGGVGVFEGVRARQFEGAVEGAQAAFELRQRLGADAAEFARGGVAEAQRRPARPLPHSRTAWREPA